MPLIPALRMLGQEGLSGMQIQPGLQYRVNFRSAWATVQSKFQVSLDYQGRACLKKEKEKKLLISVLLV